jgi:hypothetical protein
MCTSKNAPKLASLRQNPSVAITIDTEVHPPTILLVRGTVELDEVAGIPEEYLEMNGSYEMTAEQRVEWEAEIRSLYDGMVRIVRKPLPAATGTRDPVATIRGHGAEWQGHLAAAQRDHEMDGRRGRSVLPVAGCVGVAIR